MFLNRIIGVAAAALVLVLLVGSYFMFGYSSDVDPCPDAKPFQSDESSLGRAIYAKERFICRLDRYAAWYSDAKSFYGTTWYSAGLLISILSALTSLFVALGFAQAPGWKRTVTIVLPATVTLLSTVVVQFRIQEYWELRESGRIAVVRLSLEAEHIPEENPDAIRQALYELEKRLIEIEAQQAQAFYGFLGATGVVESTKRDGSSANLATPTQESSPGGGD